MKILNLFFRHKDKIVKHFLIFKTILLLFATCSLILAFYPLKLDVKNGDFTTRMQSLEKKIFTKENFIKMNEIYTFETNPKKSDRETILIRGISDELDFFRYLANGLINSKITRHNFKFVISNNKSYKIKTAGYFCEIFIFISKNFLVNNYIFKKISPNSDFLFVTENFFHVKNIYRIWDLILPHDFDKTHNFIEISIPSGQIKYAISYLRCISNADAFIFGTSFYFVTKKYFHQMIFFVPFFITMSLIFASDFLIKDHKIRPPMSLYFIISPILAIFCIFDENLQMALNILFFLSIDFKIALIFTFTVYVKEIFLHFYKILRYRKSRSKKIN
ncbi:putative transporter [Pseudoloma neurophilia]|uniref:Putative transporter n=1 Tax=Pseudoloma neurophilia TaxID=146866 RepID=A0A0R0M0U7_9MICR|nr:putative transporter [Pseudoloma neurophilia]